MPAPVLDQAALAAKIHELLEERDGRYYATAEGAARLTDWLRGQGFHFTARVDENGRFKIGYSAAGRTPVGHRCHWPGCPVDVPPSMWGCKPHWFRLPMQLRARIWRAYRPGQEDDKRPSAEYLTVELEAQEWAMAHPEKPPRRRRG